jgi:hypothetical protein
MRHRGLTLYNVSVVNVKIRHRGLVLYYGLDRSELQGRQGTVSEEATDSKD